jgi:hypothetical protein
MLGLYLYASGAQRQTITVLSTLGISESYTNIITKNKRRATKKPEKEETHEEIDAPETQREGGEDNGSTRSSFTGTLHQLSESLRTNIRSIASTGLYSIVYDNINMMFRNAEQIVGRHGRFAFQILVLI